MITDVHEGIVLRTYIPKKQKLAILDKKLGRIECVPQNQKSAYRLSHGAYVSYALRAWHAQYLLHDPNILDLPFYWAYENFLFFHHVLELCYYFLPIDGQSADIFELIYILYDRPKLLQTTLSRKIFLCRFFWKLGIYPYNAESFDSCLFSLISGPLDSNLSIADEKIAHQHIQKWLLACVNTHPYAHRLKTIDFLIKLDSYE